MHHWFRGMDAPVFTSRALVKTRSIGKVNLALRQQVLAPYT